MISEIGQKFYDFMTTGDVRLMGVVNVTPDSFSGVGNTLDPQAAIDHGLKLLEEGAHILDIGGESTRPGAEPVEPEEEVRRVRPVIEGLAKHAPWISIDTRNAATMSAAIEAGAHIINDISALTHDPRAIDVVVASNVPLILMHMQGAPETMQENPSYNNVIDEVNAFFEKRFSFLQTRGIDKKMVYFDPGIGFGKTLEHNLLIIRNIRKILRFETPLLLGVSRKRFIGHITGEGDPKLRLPGSLAATLSLYQQGVRFFRVHDVAATKQAIEVFQATSALG